MLRFSVFDMKAQGLRNLKLSVANQSREAISFYIYKCINEYENIFAGQGYNPDQCY